ncbi:MAG: recombination protein NinB [Sulfuriferula sp.]
MHDLGGWAVTKQVYRLVHSEARRRAAQAVQEAPGGMIVTIAEASRTLDQNAAQWPILQAISEQLQWPVNGKMECLTPDEFKDILTVAFKGDSIRLAQGVSGGVVMLGARTSKMNKKEFSDWLEFLHWFCAEKNIDLRLAA